MSSNDYANRHLSLRQAYAYLVWTKSALTPSNVPFRLGKYILLLIASFDDCDTLYIHCICTVCTLYIHDALNTTKRMCMFIGQQRRAPRGSCLACVHQGGKAWQTTKKIP